MAALQSVDLAVCPCAPAALQLLWMGYFPCAPLGPTLAVSLQLLSFVQQLFMCIPPNTSAWCESLEAYLAAMGYEVDTKSWVIADDTCRRSWQSNNSEHGFSDVDAIVCIDACFTQKCRSGHPDDPVNPTATVFLSQEDICAMEHEVNELQKSKSSTQRRSGQPLKKNYLGDGEDEFEEGMRITMSVLKGCNESFTAADERHQKYFMPLVINGHVSLSITPENVKDLGYLMERDYHQCLFVIDFQSLTGLGQWLLCHWNHCQEKTATANRGLRRCGVDIPTLQAEWVAQVSAQKKPAPCHSSKAAENMILQIMATQKSLGNYEAKAESVIKRPHTQGKSSSGVNSPTPDPKGLFVQLDVDDDIWQDIGLGDDSDGLLPPWLADEKVHSRIRSLLELRHCEEEERHLLQERRALTEWFSEEWGHVQKTRQSADVDLAYELDCRALRLAEATRGYPGTPNENWGASDEELHSMVQGGHVIYIDGDNEERFDGLESEGEEDEDEVMDD
ncbi:hypothetical protein F5J12DRAFT_786017 [Pisolithus orientalis]|uniref:uncharacterized protein n=1 Tax=Pisolithus orientalis TaxID=936130 RepID=UPI0022245B09|nr:uncharacterized protein F5J12DRAFT_786017 [Pisolithus orientalis]KAI5993141.1 hypothetical protein F5J12DRAFT_786017 [Pisolithus orientalis]